MVWHFNDDLRGLPDPRRRAAAAPLPQGHPDRGPGQGRGLPRRTRSPSCPSPARSSSSRSRRGPSCASRATTNYTNAAHRQAGQPRQRHLQVVRRSPTPMIAGFRAGEIDVAFDLQDSRHPEGPGPRRPGRGHPGPPVRVPAPELVAARPTSTRATKTPAAARATRRSQDRGTGCPTADPAIRQAIAYAIDKDEINTRLLGGNAQVANTNISPAAWFYADQTPATYDPEKAKQILADGGWADTNGDGIRREGRPHGQDRAVHDHPPGPPGHARPDQRVAEGRRHRQRHQPGGAVGHLRRLQRGARSTRRAPCRAATSTSPSTRSARRSTRWATTSATTAASSSPTAPTTPRSTTRTSTRPSTTSRTTSTSRGQATPWPTFQKVYVDKTVEVPLYYRKNVELAGPAARQLLRQRHPGRLDLERRGLVRQELGPEPHRSDTDGAPGDPGAPFVLTGIDHAAGVPSAQPPGDPPVSVRRPPSRMTPG